MAALSQLKNVRFQADERLDLPDLSAISSLKDEDLREYLNVLLEPGANGLVLSGFTLGATPVHPATTWPLVATDSAAVDSDGRLMVMLAGAPLTINFTYNAITYVHAYLIETDSDVDNRRAINDAVNPPEEVTVSMATRKTKTVALYTTTAAFGTPTVSGFSTSAVISGAPRKLVALFALVAGPASVTAVDFRNMLLPNGNQVAAVNGGTPLFPVPVGTSPGDRGLKGLRTLLNKLADAVSAASGAGPEWWWPAPVNLRTIAVMPLLNLQSGGIVGGGGGSGGGGAGSRVYLSEDGQTLLAPTLGTSDADRLRVSITGGNTWANIATPSYPEAYTATIFSHVLHLAGLWVAAVEGTSGSPRVWTSPDLATWTARTVSWGPGVVSGVNRLVVKPGSPSTLLLMTTSTGGATAQVAYSTDGGVTWGVVTSLPVLLPSTSYGAYGAAVTYNANAGLFIAVSATAGSYMTSPDGVVWTARTLPGTITANGGVCVTATINGVLQSFVTVTIGGVLNLLGTADGLTWKNYGVAPEALADTDGRTLAAGGSLRQVTSDGVVWHRRIFNRAAAGIALSGSVQHGVYLGNIISTLDNAFTYSFHTPRG